MLSESKGRGTENNGGSSNESRCSSKFDTGRAGKSCDCGGITTSVSQYFVFLGESRHGLVDVGSLLFGLIPGRSDSVTGGGEGDDLSFIVSLESGGVGTGGTSASLDQTVGSKGDCSRCGNGGNFESIRCPPAGDRDSSHCGGSCVSSGIDSENRRFGRSLR